MFNPAEKDVEKHGDAIWKGNEKGSITQAFTTTGFSLREALALDTQYICLEADAVALLPGWDMSKGARSERALARALDLKIVELDGPRPHKFPVKKIPA